MKNKLTFRHKFFFGMPSNADLRDYDLIVSNAAPDLTLPSAADGADLDVSNATQGDWYRIAGYGSYPFTKANGQTADQVVDEQVVDDLIAAFLASAKKLSTRLGFGSSKIPVYNGHPDALEFVGTKYADDNTVYANAVELEKRSDGLWGRFEKSNAFSELSKLGRLRISPRWALKWTDATQRQTRPVKLLSLGLVDRPNMADAAYANAKPQNTNTMNPLMLKILALLGFASDRIEASNAAGPDAISITEAEAALKAYGTTEAANAVAPIQADLDAANAQIETLTSERDTATADLEAANGQLTTHRQAHAELLVGSALSAGLITAADEAAEVEALTGASDFTEAANALQAKKPIVKTESKTKGLGGRGGEGLTEASNASTQLVDIANGLVSEGKAADFSAGWTLAREQNPKLWEAANAKPE